MNTTTKKLVGGLCIDILLATFAAVFATAQPDDATSDITEETTAQHSWRDQPDMNRIGPFATELTDEQQTELEDLMDTLRENNATPEEIRAAVDDKLDEYGVLDTRLENEITQTEQRLTMLTREKDLRDQGYSWDEIRTIINDEFDIGNTTGFHDDGGFGHGFGPGPRQGPCNMRSSEDSSNN